MEIYKRVNEEGKKGSRQWAHWDLHVDIKRQSETKPPERLLCACA